MFESLFRELVKLRRDTPDVGRAYEHYQQAMGAVARRMFDDAEFHYRRALEHDPGSSALAYNLGLLLQEAGDMHNAELYFRRCLEMQANYQAAHSSFLSLGDYSMEVSREEIFARHVNWARNFADPLTMAARQHKNPLGKNRRLKVGYVSADFRRHAVGRFIEPVLRWHDCARFEVFCYSNAAEDDEMTAHLRTLINHWRDVQAASDNELSEVIRADGIDILIDLSGHSLGNRLLAFARKPSPIQVSWLGYLNTTGMEAMDFRLTDEVADPPGVDRWYKERLLRMPQPQWCYVPQAGPVNAPVHGPSPRKGHEPLVFACMTRFMKISDAATELWVRIMKTIPTAKLKVIDVPDHAHALALKQRFADAGLGERIQTVQTLHGNAYWDAFCDIDVALDPFPYSGATTTCDCLWMGIPVVSLAGVCGAARSACSLLTSLGLSDLCAATPEDYVDIAVRLGKDRERVANLRASLRNRMLASPVCDSESFTRSVERQLHRAWAMWCEERSSDV